MNVTNYLLAAALTTLPLASTQCPCKDVPASDVDKPRVALWVNGTPKVNTTDLNSPVTVTIPAGEKFSIIVHATDSGCVKETSLDWKYYVDMGGVGQLVQPMIVPKDWSDCPQRARIDKREYQWQSQNRTYKFSGSASDFHGNEASTPQLTVIHSH